MTNKKAEGNSPQEALNAFNSKKFSRREFMVRTAQIGGAALVATSIGGVLTACGTGGESSSEAPKGEAPGVVKKRVLHFGASLPLTGTYEKVAKLYKDGYDFWTKTVGGYLKIGEEEYEIKWTIYDDKNDPTTTAQLTERLITQDKINLLVGAYGTDPVMAQAAIAKKYNMILIQGGAASTRVAQEYGGHTMFTTVGAGRLYKEMLVELAAKLDPTIKNIGLVTMDDPVYSEMAEAVKSEWAPKYGMQVVFEDVLPMDTRDFRPTVVKMKEQGNIDMVINTGWDVIAIDVIENAHLLDLNPKIMDGGHLMANPVVKETLGAKLEYVFGESWWLPSMKFPDDYHFSDSQEAAKKFQEMYGYEPTYHMAVSYSCPNTYEVALKDMPPDDPFNQDLLRDKIRSIKYRNVLGTVSFDEIGRIQLRMPVLQCQGKELQIVPVYPEEVALAQPIYPVPAWKERGL